MGLRGLRCVGRALGLGGKRLGGQIGCVKLIMGEGGILFTQHDMYKLEYT